VAKTHKANAKYALIGGIVGWIIAIIISLAYQVSSQNALSQSSSDIYGVTTPKLSPDEQTIVDEASKQLEQNLSQEASVPGDTNTQPDQAATQNGSNVKFANGMLTSSDYKIKITNYKIVPAGAPGNDWEDKSVIVFYFQATNVSGYMPLDPPNAWIMYLNAYQDSGSLTNSLYNVDDNCGVTIKQGKTLSGAMAYTLADLKTPVTVAASYWDVDNGAIGGAGTTTYKIK